MRYQVPQFIEVEDKLFGPLTMKQFIYVGGGAGLSFILYRLIPYLFISIMFIAPVAVFFLALAFYKPNGKPFADMVESAVNYWFNSKLYIWKKTEPKPRTDANVTSAANADKENVSSFAVPKLSDSKLKELTWSLDVNESLYAGVKGAGPNGQKQG